MGKIDWQKFWEDYRKGEIQIEQDLFVEVGKTINKQPMTEAAFKLSIELIERELQLKRNDNLLELCCGNGLTTFRLAPLVREIHAVDFSERLITNARRFHNAPNVTYFCAEAGGFVAELVASGKFVPSKILLGDALGYFEPKTLREILSSLIKLITNSFIFAATGIPCDELKSNFYDTPERVKRYEENQLRPENTNDGIGRWWRNAELQSIGHDLNLAVDLIEQPAALSKFRIDAVFQSHQ